MPKYEMLDTYWFSYEVEAENEEAAHKQSGAVLPECLRDLVYADTVVVDEV